MKYAVIQDVSGVERFSYSKLSSYWTCKWMYKLHYIDEVKGEGNGFAQIGSLMHSIFERFYRNELSQFELADKFIEEFDEAVPNGVALKTPTGYVKVLSEQYKKQCVDYLTSFNGFEGYEVVDIENNFNLMIEIADKKILLNGFIDLITKDNNGDLFIIDWKSKSKFKNRHEVEEYARQLYTYAIYVKYRYGKYPKELWFVQFRIDHVEVVKFSMSSFEETIEWIYKTCKAIEDEKLFFPVDFSAKNDPAFFCRNLCDYGQQTGLCTFFTDYLNDGVTDGA